ncbi:predicted protein [Arabidopsis lyrata subsp. lyrata]|uniref:Predicted protein n=1 Tax=Arabidopsis lyrata subsp. lyrata TaxID=81972 RepID=D7LRD7_ARALL|nr:predicted protein [Arabidopsis lyrata subsp. lyrata]
MQPPKLCPDMESDDLGQDISTLAPNIIKSKARPHFAFFCGSHSKKQYFIDHGDIIRSKSSRYVFFFLIIIFINYPKWAGLGFYKNNPVTKGSRTESCRRNEKKLDPVVSPEAECRSTNSGGIQAPRLCGGTERSKPTTKEPDFRHRSFSDEPPNPLRSSRNAQHPTSDIDVLKFHNKC